MSRTDLFHDETTLDLCAGARRFLTDAVDHERIMAWDATDAGLDPAVWKEVAAMGWPTLAASGPHGGGGTAVMLGALLEEVAHSGLASPLLGAASAALVLEGARAAGTAPACTDDVLAGLGSGQVAVLAPGSRHEARPSVATSAGAAAIDGGPLLVGWASMASTLVVLADAGDQPVLAVLGTDQPAVEATPVRLMDNRRAAAVRLTGATASDGAWVRVEPALADELVARHALLHAASLVGTCRRMLDLSVTHVTERHQFGAPIGSFQAVQHLLADVATALDVAALSVHEGLEQVAAGQPCGRSAATSDWLVSRAAALAATTAAQVHGGVGMITEHPLHVFFRQAAAAQAATGPDRDRLELLARALIDG